MQDVVESVVAKMVDRVIESEWKDVLNEIIGDELQSIVNDKSFIRDVVKKQLEGHVREYNNLLWETIDNTLRTIAENFVKDKEVQAAVRKVVVEDVLLGAGKDTIIDEVYETSLIHKIVDVVAPQVLKTVKAAVKNEK